MGIISAQHWIAFIFLAMRYILNIVLLTHAALLDQNVADHRSLLGFQIFLIDLSLFVFTFLVFTGEFDIN